MSIADCREWFSAITVVSPLRLGDEEKNEDCARWFVQSQVASLCDGCTSSPHSAAAAQLGVEFSPALYGGEVRERLGALCDLLISRRLEVQHGAINLPTDTPPAMRPALQEAARARLANAFQTTLVSMCLTLSDNEVVADLVHCGDSAYFVFASDGGLLTTSLSGTSSPIQVDGVAVASGEALHFGPGDELLIKIVGRGSDRPCLAQSSGIHPKHARKWFLCVPLDQSISAKPASEGASDTPAFWFNKNELLLVPEYIIGKTASGTALKYHCVTYSSLIRRVHATPSTPALDGRCSVTTVLPDHYHSERWVYQQERFPLDAHFVLSSDGFYGCFSTPTELWSWLITNETRLCDPDRCEQAMMELHQRLHANSGDDDISLVWVRPGKWTRCRSAARRPNHVSGGNDG